MSAMIDPIVVEMPDSSVSPDGSFVEMTLKNSDGSIQVIRFSPDTMMNFVGKLFQLFLNQKIQMESMVGHAYIQAIQAVTTSAQQAIGGKAVILHFRLQNGLPVAFSILPSEAEELHRQIGEAVKKARQEPSKDRKRSA